MIRALPARIIRALPRAHPRTYVTDGLTKNLLSPLEEILTLSNAREGLTTMPDKWDELCEIAECEHCDEQGMRLNGLHRCDHIDYAAIAKRGIAKVIQALKEAKQQ